MVKLAGDFSLPKWDQRRCTVATVILGVAQLVVAVILAVLSVYLGVYLFEWTTRGINEWAEVQRGNLSVGMVLGAIATAVAIILRPATQVHLTGWDVGQYWLPFYALLIEVIQLLVGLILAVGSIWLALALFGRLTGQIDEMEELKKDNRAMAGLLVGVILAIALLVSSAVENLTGPLALLFR
jgi:uncharacterized membrane protein YjfL (UPF0719 family)